ncbi:hypothetical protein B296_00006685 [Ensete ventricosum]|uniref:Uncharacterized protein n=1 Tax=Ensete ventricosum TaxID=4639 RepID=A0A426ZB15_ENSVE|nr:hypothetical protein B296_00006685 [Ensete ventricosum]
MHKVQHRGGGQSQVTFVFLTLKRIGETKYPSSLINPAEELCVGSKILRRSLIEDNSCQIIANGD